MDNNQQEEEIKDIIKLHTTDPKAGSINIFKPKQGGKQFESLALITFKTTTLKYLFERNFAVWKRTNPTKNGKLSISRAPPTKIPGEDHNAKPNDIRRQIAGFYNLKVNQLKDALNTNAQRYKELTEEQVTSMPVQLKVKYKPFATYWEFLDPSNNITYCTYTPGMDPFGDHDFSKDIPNPETNYFKQQ